MRKYISAAAALFLVAVGLVGCNYLPGDPAGPDRAERLVDGRLEMALGMCGDEKITRVQVYRRGKSNPDPDLLLWDARPTSQGQFPANVFVLGDDGTFGFLPDVPLRGSFPEEMFVVITTSEDLIYTVAEKSDFKLSKNDEWWLSGKSVSLSDVDNPRCKP